MANAVTINHCWGLAGVKTIDEKMQDGWHQDSHLRAYASILPIVGTVTFIFNMGRGAIISKYFLKECTAPNGNFDEKNYNNFCAMIYDKYKGLHAISGVGTIALLASAVALGVLTLNPLVINAMTLSFFAIGLGQKHIKLVLANNYATYASPIRRALSLLPVIGAFTFIYNLVKDEAEVEKIKNGQTEDFRRGRASSNNYYNAKINAFRRRTIIHLASSSALTCVLLVCAVAKGIFVVAPAYYVGLGVFSLASTLYGIKTRLIVPNHRNLSN